MPNLNLLRQQIVETACVSGEGHIPSALSVLDLLWVLYDRVMRFDVQAPRSEDRDRFILSKGHASLGLYAVLSAKGFFPSELMKDFGKFSSILGGHPDCNKVPGVEASTGSLGHGLPMSVGVALGLRIKNVPRHVYVLVGDGEANEGTIWEAALLAAHHGLDNLTCLVDFNRSTDRALKMDSLEDKFASFGWSAETIDGHDHEQIFQALTRRQPGKPVAIVARTIKGKGVARMEGNPAWHHASPKPAELEEILRELSGGRS